MINILKGWTNVLLNLETEKARKKAEICLKCKFIKEDVFEIIEDNQLKEINGAICGICKCPLIAKLRTNDKCPKGKF